MAQTPPLSTRWEYGYGQVHWSDSQIVNGALLQLDVISKVITVSADALEAIGAKPSAGTVLTTVL